MSPKTKPRCKRYRHDMDAIQAQSGPYHIKQVCNTATTREKKRSTFFDSSPIFSSRGSFMQSKRVTRGSLFDAHMAEPSVRQPSLDTKLAKSSKKHVRALNTQFSRKVGGLVQDAMTEQHVVMEQGGACSRINRELNFPQDGNLDSDSDSETETETELNIPIEPVSKERKGVRGPTSMPKIWGQPPDKLISVSFNALGQANDEGNTCTLAHFLGTVARNGRYCPLHYKDWRLIPLSYKEEMLKTVKAKFQIPPGNEPYILTQINKKWKYWKNYVKSLTFDPDAPNEEQLLSISDRVDEEQYKALTEHWMSDKFKVTSTRNKGARAELNLFHRMGKRSFAVMKEIMKKKLERYPTRAELFDECYCTAKGTNAILNDKVKQMKEMEEKEPQIANVPRCDDAFAKVMGSDKHGRVRMYGTGVTRGDIYGTIPSRDLSYRLAMEYKEKYDVLSEKVEILSAQISGRFRSNVQSEDQDLPQVNRQSGTSTSRLKRIKVRSRVVLKSLEDINKIVATGYVSEMDCIRVNGKELGSGWCEIIIQSVVEKDACLFKPYDLIQTIGDSIGAPVAWPLALVAQDDIDA